MLVRNSTGPPPVIGVPDDGDVLTSDEGASTGGEPPVPGNTPYVRADLDAGRPASRLPAAVRDLGLREKVVMAPIVASLVLLGRATLYGLMAGGEAGVSRALGIICDEISRALALTGCRSPGELTRGHLAIPGAG